MVERRILMADADPKAADEFRQALGPAWVVVEAASGPAALAEIQNQPFDVVAADLDLPELNGAEVLDLIRIAHPKTIRFLAATEDQKQRAMCHVAGGNQFLAKPFDTSTLKSTVERCLAADHCIVSNSMRELIGRIRAFPTIPSLYLEVVSALNNPDATTSEVGAIVAKDMAMTTQLLQMLNSAYFSLPRTITEPAEAVGLLGFETVKSLVMSVKLRSQYDKVKPVYFSIDHVWRHSTNVARVAKELALLESGDNVLAAAAYTAGLLHDLGKIILAANFDSQYSGAHAIARKNRVPLCEVERDIFGADHGQIAAYLFSLWGMPAGVIEAAALHHNPRQSDNRTFSALTAVHIANALEHESNPGDDDLPAAKIDMLYLEELEVADRVPDWCRALGISAPAKPVVSAPASVKSAPKQEVTAPEQPSGRISVPWDVRRWLLAGAGVAAVVAILCCLEVVRLKHLSEPINPEPMAEAVAPAPDPAAPPAPAEPSAPSAPSAPLTPAAEAIVAAAPAAPAPAETPAPEATAAPKTEAAPTAVATPQPISVSAEDLAFNDLKLQGIFYSADNPSAIINGKLKRVSERVADFRVLDISPTSVTLEYQNHRRILSLR